ncbi:MAG TPA: hypothetical protein VJL34_02775 [Anaerolineales bacterium]|nr:hypothetical protein [Anaerolineales bacterium]
MAFDDLTDEQCKLVTTLVEDLTSGNYSSEFWALATLGRGWFLTLAGMGGAQGKEIEGFKETDLHSLSNEGYITLIPKKHGYAASLKPKAYQEYKRHKEGETKAEQEKLPLDKRVLAPSLDTNQLARIEANSEELLTELRKNYGLSRSQAAVWFRWTLGVSIFGFILLAAGITLGLAQQTTIGVVNSTAGIVTEFLALVFFRQASAANQRQDQYHHDLLRRQQILDAVQLARFI